VARDLTENQVLETTSILETLKIIDTHGVPIGLVHNDGKLVGTVTDGDIRRGILAGISLGEPVKKVMNTTPVTAPSDINDPDAISIMKRHAIHHLPLTDQTGELVGLKVLRDLEPTVGNDRAVVLMAGGLGKRLRPLTEEIPKPLIEVGGRPILETIIRRFVVQGFTRFYISLNYKAEMIRQHFSDGSHLGARISYVQEREAMGTAGALSLLSERPEKALIVMNGDLLTKVRFDHLIKFHDEGSVAATMCVREYRVSVPFGVVRTDKQFLLGIDEKPDHKFFVNAGIYVIDPEVLDMVPAKKKLDMPDLFQTMIDNGQKPSAFPLREYWIDVGHVDDLNQAQREFAGLFPDEDI